MNLADAIETAGLERGLPAQIAGRIGRRILQGQLRPGDTLPKELDLLAELQVSRTTLREAFAILASNGFIESRQRIGTRVRSSDHWNTLDSAVMAWHGETGNPGSLAEEQFEIRLAIEPMAASLAARRATPEDIARIRQALQTMGEGNDNPQRAMEADVDFHLQVIAAAHNRFLMPVASVIRAALIVSVPRTFEKFGGMDHSLPMHADIARAIEQRKPEAAARAATKLLRDTYQRNFT
ncbi:MAG: FadR family transcriptional regulator [Hyphomicrobiales bacterium]|nr:MAG: FadR family transcriptional regulator [Hyphomicrobiales bacterium]